MIVKKRIDLGKERQNRSLRLGACFDKDEVNENVQLKLGSDWLFTRSLFIIRFII